MGGRHKLADLVRGAVERDFVRGPCVRITVEPDGDEDWYWTAYNREGDKLGSGSVDQADRDSAIRCVEGHHGIVVDEDVTVELVRGAVEKEIR